MYECVTRLTPQRGEPIYSLLRNVTEGRHTPPRELRAELPPALEAIIERAMSVRAKDRYPSVYELGRALFPFASAEGRRQFDDFYNRANSEATRLGGRRPSMESGCTDTQALPHEPVPTWQQRTTHTSARPSGQRRRTKSVSPRKKSLSSALPSSRSRAVLYSLAVGALLVVAALVVVGLALWP
jgi:hypothetical protein